MNGKKHTTKYWILDWYLFIFCWIKKFVLTGKVNIFNYFLNSTQRVEGGNLGQDCLERCFGTDDGCKPCLRNALGQIKNFNFVFLKCVLFLIAHHQLKKFYIQ
jgi:hypothetical protein